MFGELVARTVAVEALADRLNRRYDAVVGPGGDDRRRPRGDRARGRPLKVVSTDVGLEVSSRVFEVTGASSTKTAIGLDCTRATCAPTRCTTRSTTRIEVGAHFLNGAVQTV